MAESFIAGATLAKSQDSVKTGQPLTLSLNFKVEGAIREVFSQKNWERAYNKHDNGFRMTIEVEIKYRTTGSDDSRVLKFQRKGA
mgnify:CR=1 FL=1